MQIPPTFVITKYFPQLRSSIDLLTYETRLFKELYEAYYSNVSFKNGLAVSYINLGLIYRDKKPDKVKAKSYFQAAKQYWVELVAIAPQYVAFRNNLEWVQEALERLGNG